MYTLPDLEKAFEHENAFYLSCHYNRIGKLLAHYESFKRTLELPGEIVECGVFKGVSLVRFAMMREILANPFQKRIVGFDVFGEFPETSYEDDRPYVESWTKAAGSKGISIDDLRRVLDHKGLGKNIELVSGNVLNTVPEYLERHPELRVALLNLDTDVYEPAVTVLESFWPRLVRGGVMLLDDYGVFPGESKAIDEFFAEKQVVIQRYPFSKTPSYVIKP